MIRQSHRTILFILALCSLAGCATATAWEHRPRNWAKPVPSYGLPNLYRVSPTLYRSAQPLPGVAESLESLNIKTIIDLQVWDGDESLPGGQMLHKVRIPVHAWRILDKDVVAVLKLLRKEENGPFLLHCEYGADRTGLMVAMYRILFEGWRREEAIMEMVHGGYGFHCIWLNIIHYVDKANLDALKSEIDKP